MSGKPFNDARIFPLQSIQIGDPYKRFEARATELDPDYIYQITEKIYADTVNLHDKAIVDACIKAAEEAGFTQLYLLDRRFVLDALREKLERDGYATFGKGGF